MTKSSVVDRRSVPLRFEDLIYVEDGPIATIILNRPESTNSLSARLLDELDHAIDSVRRSSDCEVLVITGAGGNFSAGNKTEDGGPGSNAHVEDCAESSRTAQDIAARVQEIDQITVCAVDGWCIGGGLEITLACDFVICTERSQWGMPKSDRGTAPNCGSAIRMAKRIGWRMTNEVNCLGAVYSARDGLDAGMFSRVVEHEALAQETVRLVNVLIGREAAPAAVTATPPA